jgi:hypothetical protein
MNQTPHDAGSADPQSIRSRWLLRLVLLLAAAFFACLVLPLFLGGEALIPALYGLLLLTAGFLALLAGIVVTQIWTRNREQAAFDAVSFVTAVAVLVAVPLVFFFLI